MVIVKETSPSSITDIEVITTTDALSEHQRKKKKSSNSKRRGPRKLVDYTKRGKFLPHQPNASTSSSNSYIPKSTLGRCCTESAAKDRQAQRRKEKLRPEIDEDDHNRLEKLKLSVLKPSSNERRKGRRKSYSELHEEQHQRRKKLFLFNSKRLNKSWHAFIMKSSNRISSSSSSSVNTRRDNNDDNDDDDDYKVQQDIEEKKKEIKRFISKNFTDIIPNITYNNEGYNSTDEYGGGGRGRGKGGTTNKKGMHRREEGIVQKEKVDEEKIDFLFKIPNSNDRQYRSSDLRINFPPMDTEASSVKLSILSQQRQQQQISEGGEGRARRSNIFRSFLRRRKERQKKGGKLIERFPSI